MTPPGGSSLNEVFEAFFSLRSPTKKSHIRIREDGREEERKQKYSKAVLLSTGAYSVESLPMTFWEKLAKAIRERGYEVYVNDGGQDCDRMIPGVKVLSTSIPELIRISSYLAYFVGLRSGLCDVLAQTPVRMTVLFSSAHDRDVLEVTKQDMWTHNVFEMDRVEGINAFQFVPKLTEL